jgi:hypothetical protein
MRRFLVEVSQRSEASAVKRINDSVRTLGSHFATHAEWRSKNGVCTGTMIVEAESKCAALGVVPPAMRSDAHVVHLRAA